MIVHEPEVTRQAGRVRVEARIEADHARLAGLDRLWFEIDESSGLAVSDRADPFVVAMTPVAMACREALEIRGRTSPRLAWGVRELQRAHFAWWPEHVRVVDVRYANLVEPPDDERGAGVATSFSGGVDSMHTAWHHTGERETIPGFRLTHALMINGFDLDVDLEDTGRFDVLRSIYGPFLTDLGVELVTIRTNLRAFRRAGVRADGLLRSFGTALVAPALVLHRALGRLYLPGAHGYAQFITDGSQPSTDHLLGTEGFQTIHDGAGAATRFEKIALVAGWPEALARLRVCSNPSWRNVDVERRAVDNCGSCEKCVRTMTSLELLSARAACPTFRAPLTRAGVRWAARRSRMRALENLQAAVERRRGDIAFDLRVGIALERIDRWRKAARALAHRVLGRNGARAKGRGGAGGGESSEARPAGAR